MCGCVCVCVMDVSQMTSKIIQNTFNVLQCSLPSDILDISINFVRKHKQIQLFAFIFEKKCAL